MFRYEEIVPWGRSFEEYRAMFALSDDDLGRRMLGCADGPASFNREARARGASVISADPLYALDHGTIRVRIDESYETVISQTWDNREKFVWHRFQDPDSLGAIRLQAMDDFLADYEAGGRAGRYVASTLPHLPFQDHTFGLALCSHFLFLYSDKLDARFHQRAILELLRVAGEVRIFPLLDYNGQRSRHAAEVTQLLESKGFICEIVAVDYEFQRGGREMLRCARQGEVDPARCGDPTLLSSAN
ncbi:MAG: SAM-dependent methyltransferase [Pseudomonadales bacterium]